MPCSALAASLEPPLGPPFYPINPQVIGIQAQIMRQAQIEQARAQQLIQQQHQRNIQLYYQSLKARRAQNLPVPSPAEISTTVANISSSPPQMRAIHPRAMDHYRVIASRGRLPGPAEDRRRCLDPFRLEVPRRRSYRGLVCLNPIIGKIREANKDRNSSQKSKARVQLEGREIGSSQSGMVASSEQRSLKRGRQLDSQGISKKGKQDP
ncbi:hypothetical protein TWF569_007922 [Orbilia oligospora]|nr:hypothetical protein TWF569_007922 [Orbilia oligospora]